MKHRLQMWIEDIVTTVETHCMFEITYRHMRIWAALSCDAHVANVYEDIG